MNRLSIYLSELETEALAQCAAEEMREPRDQARFLIHQELLRRGLLSDPSTQPQVVEVGKSGLLGNAPEQAG